MASFTTEVANFTWTCTHNKLLCSQRVQRSCQFLRPCCLQRINSRDAYYALHHMRAFVRDQQQLTLPSHLKQWAERLSEIQDADLRQEFFRIQSDLAGIISEDVLRSTGEFHLNNQMPNSEIDTMLRLQADRDRPFMTITKDGGFVHAPARERSQKS